MNRFISFLPGILAVAALLAVAGAASGATARWFPVGYKTAAQYPNIAARWDHHPHCAYGASCEGLYLVTRYGCSNLLYVELNILSHGAVVSFTNDSLGSLRPRQIARLTFNVYDVPAGATVQISKINCY